MTKSSLTATVASSLAACPSVFILSAAFHGCTNLMQALVQADRHRLKVTEASRVKLLFTYRTPKLKFGDVVLCERRGFAQIASLFATRIAG